jgi:nucleotide-binding universal stress UspA family protein
MYNTILVPLDGSKRAEAILRYVEELAQCYQAKVILLHVIEPEPPVVGPDLVYPGLSDEELERRAKEAESYLAARQGEFREKGIEVKTRVVHGPIVAEIINAAEREGAELIAMASHGRTGMARVFYGSVAAGVLHRIDRPLLLVRSEGDQ